MVTLGRLGAVDKVCRLRTTVDRGLPRRMAVS